MTRRGVVVFWICIAVFLSSGMVGGGFFLAGADAAGNDAEFRVTEATLTDDEIVEGETAEATATIENTGDAEGDFEAEFQITADGDTQILDTQTVTLAPDESESVTLSGTVEDPGTYDADVSGEPAGELTVEEAIPEFEVTDAALEDDTILEGETAEATATIENTGDAEGDFDAEFRITDDGETQILDTETVTLAPDESRSVTLSGTVDDPGTYDAEVSDEPAGTLTVDRPADFEVIDAQLSEEDILEDESVNVTAVVENTGGVAGDFTAELRVDGETVEEREITVPPGTPKEVTFNRRFEEAGEYGVGVSDEPAGTLTVIEPEPDLSVTRATLSRSTITLGESVAVEATVRNVGDAPGSIDVELLVNGTVEDQQNVSIEPSSWEAVEFPFEPDEAGEYDVAVNDESAGTLAVKRPANLTVTNASVDSDRVLVDAPVTVEAAVTNHGDRQGETDVELEIDGQVVDSEPVIVAGGESTTVSFLESFPEAGTYDIAANGVQAGNVTVETPANLTVTHASLEPDAVVEGESATVNATVENDGDRTGELLAELVVDGQVEDNSTVTLDGHETTTITFTYTPEDADEEHEIAVNDASAGSLGVLEPADISVADASLDDESIEEGESVQVTADLENVGEVEGTFTAGLQVDNETVESSNVTVAANATETETINWTFDEAGEYNLTVGGTDAGVITVEETSSAAPAGPAPPAPTTTPDPASEDPPEDEPESSEPSDESDEEPNDVGPVINRTETSDKVTVRIDNATDDSVVVPVDLAGPETVQPSVSLLSLEIGPAGDRESFGATVSQPVVDPGERSTVPRGDALAYVDLDTDLDANATTDATLRFELDRAAIPDGLDPQNVAVLRYADGGWTSEGVTHEVNVSENTESVHLVGLPELSPVAVVALEPGTVEVVDADVPADWVRAGHETELFVTVRNPGDLPATRTLVLDVDGDPVAEWEVSLDAGETTTLEFTIKPTRGGTLTLEGTDAGTLAVGDGDDAAPAEQDATSTDVPGFGPLVAAVSVLIMSLVLHRRRYRADSV